MFTGIIEEIGKIRQIRQKENLFVVDVAAKKVLKNVKLGDSVAVDGVCLTVTAKSSSGLSFDLMRETLDKTSLGKKKKGDSVNLERPLGADSRIDGHFVTGHVDEIARVIQRQQRPNYLELVISAGRELRPYLVPKGSICIDGVSLTVGKIEGGKFSVYLIPFTRKATTLGTKKEGDFVNLEADILAKYVRRIIYSGKK